MVSFMLRPLYLLEEAASTNSVVGWVDPRAGLGALKNRMISCLCRGWNTDSSATQPVAPFLVPTDSPRLLTSETESVSYPLGLDYIPEQSVNLTASRRVEMVCFVWFLLWSCLRISGRRCSTVQFAVAVCVKMAVSVTDRWESIIENRFYQAVARGKISGKATFLN
jgi:hypothetical protein